MSLFLILRNPPECFHRTSRYISLEIFYLHLYSFNLLNYLLSDYPRINPVQLIIVRYNTMSDQVEAPTTDNASSKINRKFSAR